MVNESTALAVRAENSGSRPIEVETRLKPTVVSTLLVCVFITTSAGKSRAAEDPAAPWRGVALLTSEIGDSVSQGEILDLVRACRINFVVFDFAWITYHWPRTRMDVLRELSDRLHKENVRTAVMYRPRLLRPTEAEVHLAHTEDGSVPESHNELCLAYEDSQSWGCAWGTRALATLPSVDRVILYNLRPSCRCPECREGRSAEHAARFLRRCRVEWNKVRPGVEIGHVGVAGQYAGQVDRLFPFVVVNPQTDAPLRADDLLREFAQCRAAHPNKAMTPFLKICWASETRNSTNDVVQSIRGCDRAAAGFLLWYYEWVFHSEDGRYDPRPVVEALGGDWGRLSGYYLNRSPVCDVATRCERAGPAEKSTLESIPNPLPWDGLVAQGDRSWQERFSSCFSACGRSSGRPCLRALSPRLRRPPRPSGRFGPVSVERTTW